MNPIEQTSAWFTANNPVLYYEQMAIETDTTLVKFGDGVTAYNSIDYSGFVWIGNHLEVGITADAEIINKECIFEGQGGVIRVASTITFVVPFTGIITGWTLLETSPTPISSSIVLDAWKDTYTNYPPTVADTIFGTKPSLTASIKNQSGVLAISVTSGDIIKVVIDSVSSAKKINLIFDFLRS